MHGKTLTWLLILGLLAGAAWLAHDPQARQQASRLAERLPQPVASAPSAAELRKCVSPRGVTYTNAACPPGTRAEAASGGTLTVLPAAPAPAAAPASARPLLRELAQPAGEPSMQDRIIDQIR